MRRVLALCAGVGLARIDGAAADDVVRAAGGRGEYTHTTTLDGGAALAWWREPLGAALAIDGALGVVIATTADGTAASLANPRARASYQLSTTTALDLELTLPAASRRGAGGAVAQAMAEAHRIDPTPWLAGATTLAAGLHRRWRRPLGEVSLDAHLAWTTRGDDPDLPLIHVDAAGAVALAERIGLTAAFRTTGYGLVDDRVEDFVHTLALGARYRDCRIEVDLAVVVPVDAADRAIDALMATAAVAWRL
ncbi:MAG: hypothetical protein IPL61_04160 [Myxococcales bacterium]|nr:hypothetical protein [Myxococcales bacterium]